MPRKHKQAPDDSELPKQKRQKLTDAQLERKRELDREAQRTIRERTRNRIAYLESLVKTLQGDQDGRVERLVAQLNESKEEVNRLKDALNNIVKITGSVITLQPSCPQDQQQPVHIKNDFDSPTCTVLHTATAYQDDRAHEADFQANVFDSRRTSSYYNQTDGTGSSSIDYQNPNDIHFSPTASTVEVLHVDDTSDNPSITEGVDGSRDAQSNPNETNNQLQPIPTLASSIVRNTKLDGRFWYLAGVLLSHILKTQREPLPSQDDEDIAIRAVFEGWPSVVKTYRLDRGWQWLKELDENLYFELSPAERLMHLRNCRLLLLHQISPNAGWNQSLPEHYAARPSQQHLQHDPLVEYFPWPAFRERLLFFPRKFATNKFMEALRRNLHMVWPHDPSDTFCRDPNTGRYSYSESFLHQLTDVRCYTTRPEFFEQFPELRQDIPFNDPSPFTMLSTHVPVAVRRIAQYAEEDAELPHANVRTNPWQLPTQSAASSKCRTHSSPLQVSNYSPQRLSMH